MLMLVTQVNIYLLDHAWRNKKIFLFIVIIYLFTSCNRMLYQKKWHKVRQTYKKAFIELPTDTLSLEKIDWW